MALLTSDDVSQDVQVSVTRGATSSARATRWTFSLLVPALLLYVIFFGVPSAVVLSGALEDSAITDVLDRPIYRDVLIRTLEIASVTTILCLFLGFPLAYAIWRGRRLVKLLLIVAVLFPYWTSVVVRAYGWQVMLQRGGPVSTLLVDLGLIGEDVILSRSRVGLYLALVQILLPYLVLPTLATLARLDKTLIEAAQSSGASPFTAARTVVLPLAAPGIATGCLIVFGIAAGSFVIPALLGGLGDTMLAQVIANEASLYLNWGVASSLAIVLSVISLAVVGLIALLGRRHAAIYR